MKIEAKIKIRFTEEEVKALVANACKDVKTWTPGTWEVDTAFSYLPDLIATFVPFPERPEETTPIPVPPAQQPAVNEPLPNEPTPDIPF